MTLRRFALANLVLVPVLVVAGWYFSESLPLLLFIPGVAYVTFAVLITGAWLLSHI